MIRKSYHPDSDRNVRLAHRMPPAEQMRVSFEDIRKHAQRIRRGDCDRRPVSPRQIARYGRTVPISVVLRTEIGYRCVRELGQRQRPIYGSRVGWAEMTDELRRRHRRTRWTRVEPTGSRRGR